MTKTISDEYMAGLFDGEGCVSVIKRQAKGYTYYQLELRIGMTSKAVLDAVQTTYGGNLAVASTKQPNRKPKWQWYCQGDAALRILRLIAPYLIEKAPQADLGIRFQVARNRRLPFDHDKVKRQMQWLKVDTTRRLKVA